MIHYFRYILIYIVLTILYTPSVLLAQNKQKSVDWLIGEWNGSGELFGNPAEFYMDWHYILDGRFIQLSFQNEFVSPNQNNPRFKAIGIYKKEEGDTYTGTWFDSRGVRQNLEASFESPTLTTLWSNPAIEKGKTTYTILGKKKIEVKDYVWKGAQWSEFGKAIYTKK